MHGSNTKFPKATVDERSAPTKSKPERPTPDRAWQLLGSALKLTKNARGNSTEGNRGRSPR